MNGRPPRWWAPGMPPGFGSTGPTSCCTTCPRFWMTPSAVNTPGTSARSSTTLLRGGTGAADRIGGTRRSGTWSSILLSTGEAPATSFTNDGGTRARVLTLWGHPFGRADQTTAPLVQRVNRSVLRNYGHAGPLLVQFLLSHQSDWERWRLKYQEVEEAYQGKAGADPVAGRLCNYFAALDLTAAHCPCGPGPPLGLPGPHRGPVGGPGLRGGRG